MSRRFKKSKLERIYSIDFERPAFEIGALLFMLTAFPTETEDQMTFDRLHASYCAHLLRHRASTDHDWAQQEIRVRPVLFAMPEAIVRRDLKTLERRLRDRMIAGRIANAIIFDEAGLSPVLPPGCEGFSMKQLIKLALEDLERADGRGRYDAENAEQRVWRDGLAVAHLSAAIQAFLNLPHLAGRQIDPAEIAWDAPALYWILQRAHETSELMADKLDRFATRRAPVRIQVVTHPRNIKKIRSP